MSTQAGNPSNRIPLAELIASVEATKNPERELLNRSIERVREQEPELADAIRYCAIPRRFDTHIIGILRGAEGDLETNERLLTGLLSFNFVLPQKEGGYSYHDNARRALLEEWQDDESKRGQFDRYNQRLVGLYEGQHENNQQTEQDLEKVAHILREANRPRFVQLVSASDTRLVAPLIDALYHEMLRSPEAGYELFHRHYLDYERKGRLAVCESLLNVTLEYIAHLEPSSWQESRLRWLRYFDARLRLAFGRYAECEGILRDLLPQIEGGTTFHLWASNAFGQSLQGQQKLGEARKQYEEVVELARQMGQDPYNLPLWCTRLAAVYWTLGELDQAAATYRQALEFARAEGANPDIEAYARVDLSGVLQESGKWVEAFDTALEALHFTRTRLPQDRGAYEAVLTRFMLLLAKYDPRLLDTLYAEWTTLVTGLEGTAPPQDYLYAELLRESDQLERLEDYLASCWQDESRSADNIVVHSQLLLQEALLRELQGRLDNAIALYTEVIERTHDTSLARWERATAFTNRGVQFAQRADEERAEADFKAATAEWKSIGHERLVALLEVSRARSLRRQGRIREAQKRLDKARPSLENGSPGFQADYCSVQGDVYRDQARWAEARSHYQQALQGSLSLNQSKIAVEALNSLSVVASARGQWEEATQHSAETIELLRRLSERKQYRPSPESVRADKEDARGLQNLFDMGSDDQSSTERARDLFRSAAKKIPENIWYQFNLAYTCVQLEEWNQAARAIDAIFKHGPEWAHSTVLHKHRDDFSSRANKFLSAVSLRTIRSSSSTHKEGATMPNESSREKPPIVNAGSPQPSLPEEKGSPYNLWFAWSVLGVAVVAYIVTMLLFRGLFEDSAVVTGALGALFTLVGTVAGAYFGVKSSSDSADRAKRQVDEANARTERANRSAKAALLEVDPNKSQELRAKGLV